jgi:hypothetical protein
VKNSMSSVEELLKKRITEILKAHPKGLVFDKLREFLEEGEGIYVNGVFLRRIVASMIVEGIICKEPSETLKKMMLKLCKN